MELLLGAIPIVLGVGFIWTRVSKLLVLLKEVTDVLVAVTKAFDDKKLTPEEIEEIKKQAVEVAAAAKALVSK